MAKAKLKPTTALILFAEALKIGVAEYGSPSFVREQLTQALEVETVPWTCRRIEVRGRVPDAYRWLTEIRSYPSWGPGRFWRCPDDPRVRCYVNEDESSVTWCSTGTVTEDNPAFTVTALGVLVPRRAAVKLFPGLDATKTWIVATVKAMQQAGQIPADCSRSKLADVLAEKMKADTSIHRSVSAGRIRNILRELEL